MAAGGSIMSEWTPVIGLEVHAELETESKMFSNCPVVDSVEAPPNSAVDALSLGMPGTLPVINMQAMDYGMMVGLALNCEIPPFNQFARKSYFYPDLPKGYQISQYQYPLAINGHVDIVLEDGREKRIGVTRAHMEEDTGKLTHTVDGNSLIDYNRAGVPLLEIVSEPDINSSEEAEAYARKLRTILQYLGVNNGDMSKGVLRFEANVSVMHQDDTEFRTRTEIKNLNSIRSMVRAIDTEVQRQIDLYRSGDTVKQATLGWDENRQQIVIQRVKERADEYRYFPEPDLPVVEVSREWVDRVRAQLPELPDAKQRRFIEALGLSAYDAGVLANDRAVALYFQDVVAQGADPKSAANWMLGSLFSLLNRAGVDRDSIAETKVSAAHLAELVKMVDADVLNKGSAGKALTIMWETGDAPATIVEREGLAQVSDEGVITQAVDTVLSGNAELVQRYLDGNDKLFGALMGQCMGALRGKGNPQTVTRILRDKLARMK
jgi:aspartyl-tRNA(Asn)/glutamyl-tRNA(Gln) amidotransferase subunit B